MYTKTLTKSDNSNHNFDLQNYIERLIRDHSGDEDTDDEKRRVLLKIIRQALAWWSTSLCIQTILGARCVKITDIPSMVRSRMNSKNMPKHTKLGENKDAEMEELIASFGYSVVDIPADGDCLFTSTAFQLLQLFNGPNEYSDALKVHLNGLGRKEGKNLNN